MIDRCSFRWTPAADSPEVQCTIRGDIDHEYHKWNLVEHDLWDRAAREPR